MEHRKNKKALVIINPGAGLSIKQSTIQDLVSNKLETLGYNFDIFVLNRGFEKKIAGYDFSNLDLMVAVGGDGTVKVAGRTIIENKLNVPLAIIPFGSANVVATSLGLPVMVKPALKVLDSIKKIVKIDVGLINRTHYFLVGFSVGYVSKIVTGTGKKLKKRFGFFGYLLRLLFNKIKIRKIKFEIKTKNKTFWIKGNSLIIFNAMNYFGLTPKKKINLRDGIFNLYVLTNKTFIGLLEIFFNMFWYQRPPRHVFSLDNNFFQIVLGRNRDLKSCQIDGDYINLNSKNIEIKVLPKVLKVVVGK